MNEKIQNILTEIESVIVGKNENVEKILMAILAQGHVLMEDVPGVGKTTTALTFAKVLGLDTRRVQFTSDTVPSDVIGYSVYDKSADSFVYKPGAIMTNLLLADEINRTSSKTQSALLEAMEEHRVTVDGQTYDLPTPFVVLATQNPDWLGWHNAPAQLAARPLPHPPQHGLPRPQAARSTFSATATAKIPSTASSPSSPKDELLQLVQETRNVEANDRIFDYVTTLAEATRTHPMVELGVSPRGALALCRMAKAHAFLAGRDYAVPEDVAAVFPDVCAHRLILSAKARMMEEKAENILAEILKSVDMPVLKA